MDNYYHENTILFDSNYDKFARSSKKGRENFIRDLLLTIDQLYNVPSISKYINLGSFQRRMGAIRFNLDLLIMLQGGLTKMDLILKVCIFIEDLLNLSLII